MRFFAAAVLVLAFVLVTSSRIALADGDINTETSAGVVQALGEPDDTDDDTVNVQLVVLGILGAVIFVALPLGYAVRRRMGRTAYTPPADAH